MTRSQPKQEPATRGLFVAQKLPQECLTVTQWRNTVTPTTQHTAPTLLKNQMDNARPPAMGHARPQALQLHAPTTKTRKDCAGGATMAPRSGNRPSKTPAMCMPDIPGAAPRGVEITRAYTSASSPDPLGAAGLKQGVNPARGPMCEFLACSSAVERLAVNQDVRGSIPRLPATNLVQADRTTGSMQARTV